jgi:D-alanyl-D-alanine carboxypeptidase/D-alanyl-D-alanine-endopeptidase (penicillin-binding protein 4)
LTNKCISKPGAKSATPVIARHPGTFDFVLSGQVAKRGTLQSISIPQPNLFAATAIREHLAAKGVTVAGRLRFERLRRGGHELASECRVIAEHRTPLADVLARIGHDSQNLFAKAMMKRLGYEGSMQRGASNSVGSWQTGRQAILGTLSRAGCDTIRMVVADGSGLARTNRASAQDFVSLLQYMHSHPRRQQFINSLGGNRTGGALVKRFSNIAGDVFAKTGYMSGVRSLSGYVRTTDDHWYAFSIIFNGFPGQSTPYFQIQEKVCKALADTARNGPS